MIFKHEITRKCKTADHERMAAYLHQEFERLIATTPELTKRRSFGPEGWHMSDNSKSQTKGNEPEALFREFESHGLTPVYLSRMHFVWAGGVKSERYDTYAHYMFGDQVQLKVEGPNRIVVDGIGSAFERIASCMEAGVPTNGANVPQQPTESWLAKTWREHTATAIVGLVVTVAGAAIAYFFGIN